MASLADTKFFKSLHYTALNPLPTILDELHLALEHVENPIMQTMQMISEFHGPFNGASQQLAQMVNSFNSAIGKFESSLQKISSSITNKINQMQGIIADLESTVNRINQITTFSMDVPILRSFISKAQDLHPLINDLIQREIGKFPFFQQISENIGLFYNLHIVQDVIDAPARILSNIGLKTTETCNVLRPQLFKKIFRPLAEMVEESTNFLDSCMHRCQPLYEMGSWMGAYSKGKPLAHGYNNCNDVFHKPRMLEAQKGAMLSLISHFGDRVRLLNSFFPVKMQVNMFTETDQIQTEHGPVMVDEHGRGFPKYKNPSPEDNLEAMGASKIKESIKY